MTVKTYDSRTQEKTVMDRNSVDWRGYFAASPTPFTESGDIDFPAFEKLLRYFLGEGAHGIVVNGSSGEWYAQNYDERVRVAASAVNTVERAVPTIIGVSSISPDETVALAEHAKSIGADGVLFSPPPGWRLSTSEVLDYYRGTCALIELPVMLYNIPADVATDLRPATIAQLADLPNVVAVKDSTRDDLQFFDTVQAAGEKIRVFGNVLTRPGLGMMAGGWGGDGYIGGAMLYGRKLAEAFEAVWNGRFDEALPIVDRLEKLQIALNDHDGNGFYGGIPGQMKAVLNLLGQPAGLPRFPRGAVEHDPAAVAGLSAVLADHGLIPVSL